MYLITDMYYILRFFLNVFFLHTLPFITRDHNRSVCNHPRLFEIKIKNNVGFFKQFYHYLMFFHLFNSWNTVGMIQRQRLQNNYFIEQ